MTVRTYLSNTLIGWGRSIGRKEGQTELAVTISEHSIDTRMVETTKEHRAWDDGLYRYGNVFVKGYANPVKPVVDHNKELENPDTIDIEEGGDNESDESEGSHVELISSPRYRDYMTQDLISQLLNPREQWRLIAYAIIALGAVMLINVVVTMSAAGVF